MCVMLCFFFYSSDAQKNVQLCFRAVKVLPCVMISSVSVCDGEVRHNVYEL